jgi:acetyl-CoA synthetase
MAQKNIKSVLHEQRVFAPPAKFAKRATLRHAALEAMYAKAAEDYVGFWADSGGRRNRLAQAVHGTARRQRRPNYRWFSDGQLNVCYNCIDKNLAAHADKPAIVFEGEPGDVRTLSYRDLHFEVCRFANALKARGIEKGDRVVIYMPLIPRH